MRLHARSSKRDNDTTLFVYVTQKIIDLFRKEI